MDLSINTNLQYAVLVLLQSLIWTEVGFFGFNGKDLTQNVLMHHSLNQPSSLIIIGIWTQCED